MSSLDELQLLRDTEQVALGDQPEVVFITLPLVGKGFAKKGFK